MSDDEPPTARRLVDRDFVATTAAMTSFFVAVGMGLTLVPRFVVDELGETNRLVGWSAAAYSVLAVACRPLLTAGVARWGNRSVLRIGAIGGAVGFALHAGVGSSAALLVVRGITGAFEALLYVAAANLISERAPAERRAEAISYHSVGLFLALGVGPILGEVFVGASWTRAGFAVAGLFALAGGVWSLAVADDAPAPGTGTRTKGRTFHRGGALLGVVLALPMFGYQGWSSFLKLRADEVGASAGALFATYSVLTLLVRLFGARLPERLGLTRAAPIATAAMAVGLAMAGTVDGAVGMWLAVVVISVAISLLYPSLIALAARAAGDPLERAAAISTFTAFFEIGAAAGGAVLGPVADAGGYQTAYLVGAVTAAAGVVVYRALVLDRIAR